MYFKNKELTELFFLKHKHDSTNGYVEHNDILKKSMSSYLYNNKNVNEFLIKLEPMVLTFFDNFTIIKNFKNYIIDKYDYRHSK